jgi:hypothetical protein
MNPAQVLEQPRAGAEEHGHQMHMNLVDAAGPQQLLADAGPITSGHCRAGLLYTKRGIVAAETDLVILRQRLPTDTRVALADTCIPVDKILAPLGVRLDRRVLCAEAARIPLARTWR